MTDTPTDTPAPAPAADPPPVAVNAPWWLISSVLVDKNGVTTSLGALEQAFTADMARHAFIDRVLTNYGPAGYAIREVRVSDTVGLSIVDARPATPAEGAQTA